jgi:class 3 adenylate cyclase
MSLGTIQAGRGNFAEAHKLLTEGWRRAVANTELQRTFPMATAIAALAWLEDRPLEGLHALDTINERLERHGNRWERAEVVYRRLRAGLEVGPPDDAPPPFRHWFEGDYRGAFEAWEALGARYRAVDALYESDSVKDLEEAVARLRGMGATGSLARFEARLGELRSQVRRVMTVLFTDIVGSTGLAGRLGDAEWRKVLDRHDATAARVVTGHDGRVVKGTGDGVMATFDSPSQAIAAARRLVADLDAEGTTIRAGLHTGEVVTRADDIGGIAVHVAARIGAQADAGQVLVSGTTRDLVAGGTFSFIDLGMRQLKGIEDEWRLYEIVG